MGAKPLPIYVVVDGCSRGIESPFVGAIGTPEYTAPAEASAEAERRELDWLLTSGVLGRSGNLARVLKYICEERFAGRAQQIKEYTIATEALGRRADFDPNSDTIVRVTFHSLRKRLLEVYQNEGANRPLRLVVPPGHYDPHFVSAPPLNPPHPQPPEQKATSENHALSAPLDQLAIPSRPEPSTDRISPWPVALILLAVVIAASVLWSLRHQPTFGSRSSDSASTAAPVPQAAIHALMGAGRKPYVDHSGITWSATNYCQGGANVTVTPQKIEGTEDAPLYFGGVRGIAHCVFPVTQKLYEIHFHFAETTDLQPASTTGHVIHQCRTAHRRGCCR